MNLGARLSKTEDPIAHLLAIGKSAKEIADIRCISELTVQNHRKNIYRKADVQKATELCVWWFCRTFSIKLEQITAMMLLMIFCAGENAGTHDDMNRPRAQELREMRCRKRCPGREWEIEW